MDRVIKLKRSFYRYWPFDNHFLKAHADLAFLVGKHVPEPGVVKAMCVPNGFALPYLLLLERITLFSSLKAYCYYFI